ncbi:MAG TPA: FtsX-like permease family protein, partial [Terriglobales bacterium]
SSGVSPDQAQQLAQPAFWQAAQEGVGRLDPKQWPAHLGFEEIKGIGSYATDYEKPVEIMMGLVGLVLLIACTNVALIILARNSARTREFAVRMASGASSVRLFRQLLLESSLLVVAGAGFGWGLAVEGTRILAAWANIDSGLAPDLRVLLFTLVIGVAATMAFGLAPLWSTRQIEVEQALRSASQTASQSRSKIRSGNLAIAFQVAMCLSLLVASSLTVRTLLNYEHIDLGMRANNLFVFDVAPQGLSSNAQAFRFYERLLARLTEVPGVQSASLVRTRPGSGWEHTSGITVDGVDIRHDVAPHTSVYHNSVGPEFFRTMGIPILQGRGITEADSSESHQVAVVSESFANTFLRNGALGHRLGDRPGAEIVGVVKDSRVARARETDLPAVYYPLYQTDLLGQITVEVRSSGNPVALLPVMRRAVHDLDPNLPLQDPMTEATQFAETYVTPRLFARLALGFGLLAILLVATGLYGTLSYRVQRRTNEIGVRMALGAPRASVLTMVVRESVLIFLIGFSAGLPLAWAVAALLRAQLYGLSYLDPISFLVATAVTLSVSLGASFLPARRAAKVDPMVALRYE